MRFRVQGDGPARIEPDPQVPAGVDRLDGPELTIRDLPLAIRRGELHAVARRERPVCLSIERDALQPTRIVGDARPVLAPDRHEIVRRVDVRDARILAGREPVGPAAFRVAHHVARRVLLGPLAVGARHVLPGDQAPARGAPGAAPAPAACIARWITSLSSVARVIVRRHDEGALRLPQVLARDRRGAVPRGRRSRARDPGCRAAGSRPWTSPRDSCSTTAFSAGSFCRTMASRRAVSIPASWSC